MPVSPKRGTNPRQQHRGSNTSQHPPPSPDRSSATGSPRRRLSRLPNAQYPSSSPTSANAPNHLGNTGPSFTRGTTLLGGSRETSASMRQQPNNTTITLTTSDDNNNNNRALTQAAGRAFEPSSPQRRRRAQLPRQTEEQLMALYLKYDGITMDKVPNLVAELNLTIPVDFDVSPYFSAQAGATTAAPPSSSAIAVAGGGGAMSNILQPEDLMQFVVDLQYAVGHPNNVVLDTCQVISQQHQQLTRLDVGTPTLAESTTNMETSRSMSIRPSISGPSGYVNAGDFVERANIEDALSQIFPTEVNIVDVTITTVFEEQRQLQLAAAAAAATTAAKAPLAKTVSSGNLLKKPAPPPPPSRQSLEEFQKFLVSDSAVHLLLQAVFIRCGASDDSGCGLVLTRQTLEHLIRDRQDKRGMPTTYAEVYEALSPAGTFAGDIEQSVFENVAERQLAMASTRAAAAATAASTTHSQQLLHQQILQQQQQLATGTSGTAAGRKQQQLQASSAAAVGAQTTAAANNSAPSAAASAAATSTATMYSGGDQHLVSSRPPPVATLLACVAPVAVAQITSRSVLDWILSFFSTSGYHPPPGAFVSVHSAHPPTGRSNGVSGLNATGNSSSSLTATANGKKALTSTLNSFAGMGSGGGGGDDTPRGGGGGNNETTSRADIDALMDGIGSGRQRRLVNTALPRYMARKGADDEITAAIKERTRLRKVADEQKLEALRTEQMLCGLPMARRLNQILASKSPQNAAKVVNRLPEELDIDAVLNSQPPVPKPPSRPSSSNHVDRLSEPKGFALLRSQREPYEVLSSGGSLTDKYMINYDKETPRSSSDVTPIIEGALAHPYPEGPLQKISPRMVALLADPYSIPPKRLHSAKQHGIRYKYKTVVDSWREGSLQRNRTLSLTAGGGGSASGGAQQSQAVDSGDVTAATSSRCEAAAGATSSPGATTTTTTTTTSTTTTVFVYERGDGGQATDDEEGDESAHNHTATTQVMEVTEFTEEL